MFARRVFSALMLVNVSNKGKRKPVVIKLLPKQKWQLANMLPVKLTTETTQSLTTCDIIKNNPGRSKSWARSDFFCINNLRRSQTNSRTGIYDATNAPTTCQRSTAVLHGYSFLTYCSGRQKATSHLSLRRPETWMHRYGMKVIIPWKIVILLWISNKFQHQQSA